MSWHCRLRFVLPQKGWLCFPVQGLEFERKSHQKVENSLERSSFAASAANSDLFYLLKLDHNPMWPMFYLLKLARKCLLPNVPNALPPKNCSTVPTVTMPEGEFECLTLLKWGQLICPLEHFCTFHWDLFPEVGVGNPPSLHCQQHLWGGRW